MDSRGNFIFILFPTSEKSATRMAVFRDVVDGKIKNANFIDKEFWKYTVDRQIECVKGCMCIEKDNFVFFVPGYKAPRYIPEELIVELNIMKNPPSLIAWYLVDSIERQAYGRNISPEEYLSYGGKMDIIYSFDWYEAGKYHIPYLNRPVVAFPYQNRSNNPKVFFCGRDKGRLEKLKEINRYLRENGIECEFLILKEGTCKNEKDMLDIHFVDYIKYDDMIKKMEKFTCILSLAGERNHMLPLSYEESIIYNKKLITDCDFLQNLPLYNAEYQKSFSIPQEIDVNWIKEWSGVNYHYAGEFSIYAFMERIERDYYGGLLMKLAERNRKIIAEDDVCFDYHFSHIGWVRGCKNIQAVICENQQLEAIRMRKGVQIMGIHIYIQQGDMVWMGEDDRGCVGTTGKGIPICAVRILSDIRHIRCTYRIYITDLGWTKFYQNNEVCGFRGKGKISGIQIVIEDMGVCDMRAVLPI